MGLRSLAQAKEKLQRTLSPRMNRSVVSGASADHVPKGHFAVYVGKSSKRFVIPITYLSHPMFQDLLHWTEEELGFDHPMGGLSIPCTEDYFLSLTSMFRTSSSSTYC